MPSTDARVDAYITQAPEFARPILTRLRALVHRACPGVTETIKWGVPHFEHRGPLCAMGAFKAHALFFFNKAQILTRDGRPLQQPGQRALDQFGRLTSVKDLPPARVLTTLVKDAVRLNDAGVSVPRRPPRRVAPSDMPPDLRAALRANARARAAFEAFPPGEQREYVDWITGAKREETRARRLETAVRWIAEGRRRNWQYEK